MSEKPNWTPIQIRLGEVIPWTLNPRMSNKAQAQRLITSEKKWGQPQPFAVSPSKDGRVELYDGHQRFSAWLTVYGEDHIVQASQCDRFLTDEERIELVVTLHAGATGSWDWQKIASFPAPQLIEWGLDDNAFRQANLDALNIREMITAENPQDPMSEWEGMLEYENKDFIDNDNYKSIIVRFLTKDDYDNFAELIEQSLTEKTKSIWYPKQAFDQLGSKEGLVYKTDES